ncbi:peptide/nickel transport system ATP-binding protein [Antricoccus suffuscus]|uniref:Peptide/nickel transport system ATP-binding protein n=1 Tax=Antricoccus suffuscus TaxID=1629062 RepID=A0A2T1A382_9ACTN|nr:ABC transporter ATP-binding protein [Antricoccus suffuscus]PRZ43071.1 peptide/nickel transport system ATP-binding protein [Antricoccus suffuscus]
MSTLIDAPVDALDRLDTSAREPLLQIENLSIGTPTTTLVNEVSLEVGRGEIVGIVGESGSGKTLTCRAVLGLLPGTTAVTHGRITLGSQDLASFTARQWLGVRGRRVGAVFQDPASYLNPSLTIGHQIAEVLTHTADVERKEIRDRSIELLHSVGLKDSDRVLRQHPFELSGGMLQRALLAVAIAGGPELLIADEATTALDVTVQAEVLDLLERLRAEKNMSILLVSHDLALVAERTDRVAVFSEGRKVEEGPTKDIVARPQHPYTKELIGQARTVVRRHDLPAREGDDAVLDVRKINVSLGRGKKRHDILHEVDLRVRPGEIVGLIGETGSGKTTLARTVLGLARPSAGEIGVGGAEVSGLKGRRRRAWRRTGAVQYIFQDPLRALDPDLTAGESIGEPLVIAGADDIATRVRDVLDAVKLDHSLAERKPAELSGGQRQRICVARALITNPSLLICDEPASALDATNRNHILALLDELRRTRDIGILLISHDLGTLEGLADRIAVLYRGRVVETGPTSELFAAPTHPYTQRLLASTPNLEGILA